MITALILYSLVLGALVAVGAQAIDWAARRALLPRRWGWAGALALLVGLTASAPWRVPQANGTPELPAAMASSEAPAATALVSPSGLLDIVQALGERLITAPVHETLAFVSARVPQRADLAVGVLWALASLGALLVTTAALRRLDRQRRRWPHATVHGHPVRVAAHDGPAVYGVLRPEIVLPSGLLSRSVTEQQLVLVHEDEHRRAHDPLVLALSAFAVALVPWHPVAWWCASRLRLAVELDCDHRVLHRGAKPRQYGEMLVSLAASMSSRRGPFPALALLDSRSHLERRLLAMTSRPSRRTPLHLALFVVFGTAATAVACSTDVPTAAQIREADVATVTQTLGVSGNSELTEYLVNGVSVSAKDARALHPDEIASIDVRGTTDPRITEVRIVTGKKLTAQEVLVETLPEGSTEVRKVQGMPVDLHEEGEVSLVELKSTDAASQKARGRIRGAATADAAQPLVIVDGVILAQSADVLRDAKLNPDKIESIEVIKGEKASEMYGSRGKNGVISITTKKPQ